MTGKREKRLYVLQGLTEWMFAVTLVTSNLCVVATYVIAFYSMIKLGQVYTLTEVAAPALAALWGNTGAKVITNIFEHNNGGIFGTSDTTVKEEA